MRNFSSSFVFHFFLFLFKFYLFQMYRVITTVNAERLANGNRGKKNVTFTLILVIDINHILLYTKIKKT